MKNCQHSKSLLNTLRVIGPSVSITENTKPCFLSVSDPSPRPHPIQCQCITEASFSVEPLPIFKLHCLNEAHLRILVSKLYHCNFRIEGAPVFQGDFLISSMLLNEPLK